MNELLSAVAHFYRRHIIETGKQPQALILVSFLITFVLVRWITYRIHKHPGHLLHNLSIGGIHIHHLVFGILLVLLAGYLSISFNLSSLRNGLAVCYGIGAALTLDEFALWLRLEDDYWSKEGRWSVDVGIISVVLLAIVLLGWPFWMNVGYEITRLFLDIVQ